MIDSDDDVERRRQTKRARGGSRGEIEDEADDDDVIVVEVKRPKYAGATKTALTPTIQDLTIHPASDDNAWPEEQELDPAKVVNFFRVNIQRLSKHDEYQVLYFPMTDPLTEHEKRQRVVVTSERPKF